MGYLENASSSSANSHLYSQALQMKLYQAFIFSIPILFSIILFLLFYLFYLKRTFTTSILPSTTHHQPPPSSTLTLSSETGGLKVNLEDKLMEILFDEDLCAKDSMCCVCLGDFEMNEKLHQIPSCQHVFHMDCIRNWLSSNSTCPLCRRLVTIATKVRHHPPPPATMVNRNLNPQDATPQHRAVVFEGSSSTSTEMDNKSHPNEESFVVHIQNHET